MSQLMINPTITSMYKFSSRGKI